MRDPQGEQGATGPQGATGATGPQGPQGDQGLPGDWDVLRIRFDFDLGTFPDVDDWLVDIAFIDDTGNCYASARSGYSRFVVPKHIDVSFNRTLCEGVSVTVEVYAYLHLSDNLIDIDPTPAIQGGQRCGLFSPLDPNGCFLTIDNYILGSTISDSADGRDDGFLLDLGPPFGVAREVPIYVMANKVDLEDDVVVSESEVNSLSGSYHSPWDFTSAKTGENVEKVFEQISEKLVNRAVGQRYGTP